MDADLSKFPTGTAAWRALVDHALTLGDLSEVAFLELKGTLPFGDRSERKRSAVVLARAILGMGNRMPDSASTHLGGFGIVLVGVHGQAVVGAEQVDGAVLRELIQTYVGDDGPRWDYTFLDHPNGLVLALTVEPPQWGDPIHACRKNYSSEDGKFSIRDGEVLVRHPGQTVPATSHDIASLEQRRVQAPHTGAQVLLQYTAGFDHIKPDNVPSILTEVIQEKADILLREVPEERAESALYGSAFSSIASAGLMNADRRSPDTFRYDVSTWREASLTAVPDLAHEFLRHYRANGRFRLTNESHRYLEAVRAQVYFPPNVVVLRKAETTYCDHGGPFNVFQLLPDAPLPWGEDTSMSFLSRDVKPVDLSPNAFPTDAGVDEGSAGACVTWNVGDLRPGSTESSDERFAVFTEEHVSEVAVRWKVTARGVDHVFEGDVVLDCEQQGTHLSWSRQRHE